MKYFLIKVCSLFLDIMLLHTKEATQLREHGVNITFMYTGKPKNSFHSVDCNTHFIAILALLQWLGTEPTIFPRYACSYF